MLTTFLDRSMFLLLFPINKNIFESATDDLAFKIRWKSFIQFFLAGGEDSLFLCKDSTFMLVRFYTTGLNILNPRMKVFLKSQLRTSPVFLH